MRKAIILGLLAGSAALAGCNTVRGAAADVASVANAFDPNVTYATCGNYGPIDRNGDGRISAAEWNDWRNYAYTYWDTNHDGRISRAEYANCWYGGGFYSKYNRANYATSFDAFDTNHDGYLTGNEYWNAQAYGVYDRNHDGVIDATEWPW